MSMGMAHAYAAQLEDEEKDQKAAAIVVQSELQSLCRSEDWNVVNDFQKELCQAVAARGLKNDRELTAFQGFVSSACMFASLSFAQRLVELPKLVTSVVELIHAIQAEMKKFADMAVELHSIMAAFCQYVLTIQHNAGMLAVALGHSKSQLASLGKIIKPKQENLDFTSEEKETCTYLLAAMHDALQDFQTENARTADGSEKVEARLHILHDQVAAEKFVVDGRLNLYAGLKCLPDLSAGVVGAAATLFVANGVAGGTLVAAPAAGALVLPAAPVFVAAVLGGAAFAGITALMKHFLVKKNRKAQDYLVRMMKAILSVMDVNIAFKKAVNSAMINTKDLTNKLRDVSACVKMPLLRESNSMCCETALVKVEVLLKALEQIKSIDISEFSSQRTGLQFEGEKKSPRQPELA